MPRDTVPLHNSLQGPADSRRRSIVHQLQMIHFIRDPRLLTEHLPSTSQKDPRRGLLEDIRSLALALDEEAITGGMILKPWKHRTDRSHMVHNLARVK